MNVFFAENIDELLGIRAKHPEAQVMAGGTDLLVKVANRHIKPKTIICLERISELKQLRQEGAELWIGAAVTQQTILDCSIVVRRLHLLWQALAVTGSPPIRHVATLGGNLCTASPAGDSILALKLLEARVEISSCYGKRQIPVENFINGPGCTDLKQDEILSSIIVPLKWDNMRCGFYKIGHRKSLAIAIASMAALWQTDDEGTIDRVKLAWGSVGPKVISFPEIEKWLLGKPLSFNVLKDVSLMLKERFSPIDDIRATASYRREVAGNLIFKLLE